MTYDPATRQLILFGGTGEVEEERYEPNNQTWVYGPPAKATPTLSQSASAGVPLGGKVHDDATLAGGESPTGKVSFELFGPSDTECRATPVFTSEVTVSEAGTYESAAYEPAEAGTYHWIVTYSGDVGNEAVGTVCGEIGGSVTTTKPEARTSANATTSTGQSPPPPPTVSPRHSAHLTIFTKAPKGLINTHHFHVVVGCGGASCALRAKARVILPGLGRTVMLQGVASLAANQVRAIVFAVPKHVRALLRGYLRHHRSERMKLDVTVAMTATGSAPQTASTTLGVWTLPALR